MYCRVLGRSGGHCPPPDSARYVDFAHGPAQTPCVARAANTRVGDCRASLTNCREVTMIRALLRVVARSRGCLPHAEAGWPTTAPPTMPSTRSGASAGAGRYPRRPPGFKMRPRRAAPRRNGLLAHGCGCGIRTGAGCFCPDREPFMRRRRTDTRSKATLGSLLKGPGHRRVYHAQLRTTATDAKNAAAAIMTTRKPFGIELPMRACLHMTSPTA